MKKRLVTLVLLGALAYSCGASKIDETVILNSKEPVGSSQRPDKLYKKPSDIEGIDEIVNTKKTQFSNIGRIGFLMNYLASDELQGRDTGSEGIEKAANLIEVMFLKNGIRPYFDGYRDTISTYEKPAYNMVGVVEGNDPELKDEYIVVGAHYDHLGLVEPENGDNIANGANDNASGTTTVLELARYFGNSKSNKRSIIFALFSAEEKGLVGSKHLAQKLKAQNLDIYTVLNYEMDGVPLVDKDYLMYLTGYEMSNLAEVANSYSDITYAGYLPKAQEFNLFKRSDNYAFHEVFKVPSQTFSTFDFTNFDHYHKVGDEISEMDFGHMANVVNKSIPVIEGIANAPSKEIKYN
ncbi:M20/M25/M40 family metallo-hydrolase [Pricia sp. S334]|uniref:M20/M25/M40 family metallo-hydrolase n=1 Tax=Pricia mediterranea TaxID=3076079 RepID=A0ABU3L337_9FLAO|nr:M20/M25/M40 family metallo-hydrolase [Pricia sp. S334]MDT7828161.1 M20/M25/M40 family metallo-hydrolase [Pricia sp. S334]